MSFYTIALAGVVLLPEPATAYISFAQEIAQEIEEAPFILPAVKFIIALPFTYHFVRGMQHLFWDYTGKCLTNRWVDVLSVITIIVTIVSAAGLALVTVQSPP